MEAICHVQLQWEGENGWRCAGERRRRGGREVEAREWWTVGLSHQGCLLTCATKRGIHHAGRRQCFTQTHRHRNTLLTCWAYTHKGHSDQSQGATEHLPANSITPWGEDRCFTAPFLRCNTVLLSIIIFINHCMLWQWCLRLDCIHLIHWLLSQVTGSDMIYCRSLKNHMLHLDPVTHCLCIIHTILSFNLGDIISTCGLCNTVCIIVLFFWTLFSAYAVAGAWVLNWGVWLKWISTHWSMCWNILAFSLSYKFSILTGNTYVSG